MKRVLILGAGTAGTMVANKLSERLGDDWAITIVDQDETHHYQPGYLFIPFGIYRPEDVVKPKADFLPARADTIHAAIDLIEPAENQVRLDDGTIIDYDYLVIATGAHLRPDETPGLESDEYGKTVHDFYTLEGAKNLAEALRYWEGGRLVVNIIEMPIKCPVAPLEFTFLADAYFQEKGIRDDVEIVYVTPLDAAFTKPIAAKHLGDLLHTKNVHLEPDFYLERVDTENKKLVSYDEREVPYDLLVTIPLNFGAEVIAKSGLGNEMNYVPVDNKNFLSKKFDNIFAVGDAADLPTSKAGSVAHFAVEVFTENFLRHIEGLPMIEEFDGHANCFIESGHGKGLLIDFNYDTEPLPGKYPLPGIGPFTLLKETEMNHWGKMMFKWVYWNMLIKGKELPLPHEMLMAGKVTEGAK
ncbi:MAG: FAD/NAD(P)-binding oxidoreductase [Acidimicrobiia bacterium]|nr:FAD/NAD(P)-binding oxidoreductase [Acidimicrobiia bacterium]